MRFKAVLPLVSGLAFAAALLVLWYGFLAAYLPAKLYRPLHHWMYGLAMLALGALKLGSFYGNFLLSFGGTLLADDFHDFLEALQFFTGF